MEKRVGFVAYLLLVLANRTSNRIDSASITNKDELLEAEHRLFELVPSESFSTVIKNSWKLSPVAKVLALVTLPASIGHFDILEATGRTKQLDVETFDEKHFFD